MAVKYISVIIFLVSATCFFSWMASVEDRLIYLEKHPAKLRSNSSKVEPPTRADCSVIAKENNNYLEGHPIADAIGGGSATFKMQVYPHIDAGEVSGAILKGGCFECFIVDGLYKALERWPTAFYMEFGGNIGFDTGAVKAKFPDRYIFTWEPTKTNYAHLCSTMTLEENHFDLSNFYFYPYAAGETADYSGNQKIMSHPTIPRISFEDTPGTTNSRMKMMRVDDLMEPIFTQLFPDKNHPVVIKIDVEGYDCQCFRGMKEFFKFYGVKYIAMEWAWLMPNCDLDWLFALMKEEGLQPYGEGLPLDTKTWQQWPQNIEWMTPLMLIE
eukprot:GHVU01050188.1.p1 GENE.GHVU01050188.1~~GHVU01050188.1.p1  ORF type:complete len:327 (-),score=31.51 GHVU01050188.1:153-1133(-)